MALSLSTSMRSGFAVLSVTGSIDAQTAPELKAGVADLIAGGATKIVVDLGGVDFLDSSALGALVGVKKELGSDGVLRVACADPRLVRLFAVTRLDEVLSIVPGVDEAVAG